MEAYTRVVQTAVGVASLQADRTAVVASWEAEHTAFKVEDFVVNHTAQVVTGITLVVVNSIEAVATKMLGIGQATTMGSKGIASRIRHSVVSYWARMLERCYWPCN